MHSNYRLLTEQKPGFGARLARDRFRRLLKPSVYRCRWFANGKRCEFVINEISVIRCLCQAIDRLLHVLHRPIS
jgi:hypothetical protein